MKEKRGSMTHNILPALFDILLLPPPPEEEEKGYHPEFEEEEADIIGS